MNRLVFAIGLALLCAMPAHAQDTTVIVKDPDPPTPAITQTTTTTTAQYDTTATSTHAVAPMAVQHPVHHHRVPHTAVAYHRPVTSHETTATQTTTQTTVTVPPRTPTAVVSEHADGSVTVSTSEHAVEVPADQGDGQH